MPYHLKTNTQNPKFDIHSALIKHWIQS